MINHKEARAELAGIVGGTIAQHDPAVTIYPNGATSGVPAFPAVIIGQPSWQPEPDLRYGYDRTTFPIVIIVARSGQSDEDTVTELEQLWPAVLTGLRAAITDDQSLNDCCVESMVTRAEFGMFNLAGQQYPSQQILINLYG